ncbi:MAG: GlsB/YeaQ/YmgE family stress response membrane protein [Roseovarius sp.]
MNIIFLVIIGAVAGYLATRIMRIEVGLLPTIGIGIAGALIGGLVLQLVLAMLGLLAGLIGAVLGALVLIWLYRTYWVGRK